MTRHYVLAAGGTGGHLTPAFALACELERRGHHVALITDRRGAEIPGKPDFLPAHVLPAGRFGKNIYAPAGTLTPLDARSVEAVGAGQPHNNMQQSLTLNFVIALTGIFPSHNCRF
mgnify:CR=1 FL=1